MCLWKGHIGSSEDRPSCELGEKRRLASWGDGDSEGLGAGGVDVDVGAVEAGRVK